MRIFVAFLIPLAFFVYPAYQLRRGYLTPEGKLSIFCGVALIFVVVLGLLFPH